MKKLDNKVAIITGGAAGIGKETAKTFLREGAKVLLVDINEKSLKETVEGFNNPNIAYCKADVSKADAVKEYVRAALDNFGKIDVFSTMPELREAQDPWQTTPMISSTRSSM